MPAAAPIAAAPEAPPLVVLERGLVPYDEALALMRELVAQRARDARPDTLVLLEHPHVFTVGRRAEAARNVLVPGDVPVVAVERGGDVTYHGPGQLVGYPILKLAHGERDLARLLRGLEAALIRALAEVPGLTAERRPGFTGVWHGGRKLGSQHGGALPAPPRRDRRNPLASEREAVEAPPHRALPARVGALREDDGLRKLASIGVAVRDWVTYHGFALNVTTDLSYFRRINPCGLSPAVMGTVTAAAGGALVDDAALRAAVARAVAAVFGRRLA